MHRISGSATCRKRCNSNDDQRPRKKQCFRQNDVITQLFDEVQNERQAMTEEIEDLRRKNSKQASRIRFLEHKLSQSVPNKVHDSLQKADFYASELESSYEAQIQGSEWLYDNIIEWLWQRNHSVKCRNLELHLHLIAKHNQLNATLQQVDKLVHGLQEECNELKLRMQIQDHESEERLQKEIKLRQCRYKELHDSYEAERQALLDKAESLMTELEYNDYKHTLDLEEAKKKFEEKAKQQFSFQTLSRLNKPQLREIQRQTIETQKHLQELLNQDSICSICADREMNTAMNPCGHQFCLVCSLRVSRCPICKEDIRGRISLMRS